MKCYTDGVLLYETLHFLYETVFTFDYFFEILGIVFIWSFF